MEFIDVSAKTIEDAIAKGVAQLAAESQELVETRRTICSCCFQAGSNK